MYTWLENDGSYRIHHRNLQRLATEIHKFKHNLGPEILNEIVEPELSSYNTRCDNIVHTRAVKSVYNGTETVSFRAQKTWDVVPDDIKTLTSLNEFKTKIKQWQHKNCTCKTYDHVSHFNIYYFYLFIINCILYVLFIVILLALVFISWANCKAILV